MLVVPITSFAQLSLSDNGTAVFNYPITIPPGVGGHAPTLGLAFGNGVHGPLGFGWSVQGISLITRCPQIKAVDGFPRGVRANVEDKLCLDGLRLIQTDANGSVINGGVVSPGATNPFQTGDSAGLPTGWREYRTETDTYARIRAYGQSGGLAANGPAYFKVWTKTGQIFEYGTNSNSVSSATILPIGSTIVSQWAVSRISDVVGNYIDFNYEQAQRTWGSGPSGGPTPGREWTLAEIRYTGNGAQQPRNKVVFEYGSDRPDTPGSIQDREESYFAGTKNVSVRRLTAIRTWVNWDTSDYLSPPPSAVKVKTIKLTYDTGPRSGRSRVTKITECAGATETACQPATQFAYSGGGNETFQPNATFAANALATTTLQNLAGSRGVIPIDANGDGKTDLLRWDDSPANNRLYLSDGDGGFTQSATFAETASDDIFVKSDGCYSTLPLDIDGDGLVDLFRYSNPVNLDGNSCSSSGPIQIYRSNGTGAFTTLAYSGPALERVISTTITCPPIQRQEGLCTLPGRTLGSNFFFLDVDNDGLPDLVKTIRPAVSSARESDDPDPCQFQVCTRVYKGNGSGGFTEIPTNLANYTVYYVPKKGSGLGAPRNVVDINADGMLDVSGIEVFYAGRPTAFVSRGDGNFDPSASASACVNSIDVNGDGRADCLGVYETVTTNNLSVATGGTPAFVPVIGFNLKTAGNEMAGTNAGISVIDINGDGRHDILRWRDDAAQNAVYLSNGDGTFSTSTSFNLTTGTRQLRKSDGTSDYLIGDFTGRGSPEILRLKPLPSSGEANSNQLYEKVDKTPPDLLTSVISPTGLVTDITWNPLSNSVVGFSPRYESDRGTANAATGPMFDLTAPLYVVTATAADSGVGTGPLNRVNVQYSYAGLKVSTNGRGLLGFREMRKGGPGSDGSQLTTVMTRSQQHPYIGAMLRNETFTGLFPGSTWIGRTTFVHCDKTAAAGAEATAESTLVPCPVPTSARLQRPYLRRTIEEGRELGGVSLLPTVTTTNSFNDTGDPTSIVVSTSGTVLGVIQPVIKTTTNSYAIVNTSGDNWILGRLLRATQRNQIENQIDLVAVSAGAAPNATATVGTGMAPPRIAQPISPAALSAIVETLLD